MVKQLECLKNTNRDKLTCLPVRTWGICIQRLPGPNIKIYYHARFSFYARLSRFKRCAILLFFSSFLLSSSFVASTSCLWAVPEIYRGFQLMLGTHGVEPYRAFLARAGYSWARVGQKKCHNNAKQNSKIKNNKLNISIKGADNPTNLTFSKNTKQL